MRWMIRWVIEGDRWLAIRSAGSVIWFTKLGLTWWRIRRKRWIAVACIVSSSSMDWGWKICFFCFWISSSYGNEVDQLVPMRPWQICHCHVWSVGLLDFLIVWNNPKKMDYSSVAVVLIEEWSVRNCRLIVWIFCAPSAFGSVGLLSTCRVYQDSGWSVGSRILSRVGCWMLQSLKSDLGRGRCRSAWTG